MLWPVILPFKITAAIFAVLVIALTLYAISLKRRRAKVLVAIYALAFVFFIPSCIVVHVVTDYVRFGTFHYDKYSQVQDFRIERYLPPQSTNITLHKIGPGHWAKYTIAEEDLKDFLDHLWSQYPQYSVMSRSKLEDGALASETAYYSFEQLNWSPLKNAIAFSSPRAPNGAGATYYYDPVTRVAYHKANYW